MPTILSALAANLGKDHVVRVRRFADGDAAVVHILRHSLTPGLGVTFNMSVAEATALRDLLNCTYPSDKFPSDYAR